MYNNVSQLLGIARLDLNDRAGQIAGLQTKSEDICQNGRTNWCQPMPCADKRLRGGPSEHSVFQIQSLDIMPANKLESYN